MEAEFSSFSLFMYYIDHPGSTAIKILHAVDHKQILENGGTDSTASSESWHSKNRPKMLTSQPER